MPKQLTVGEVLSAVRTNCGFLGSARNDTGRIVGSWHFDRCPAHSVGWNEWDITEDRLTE